MAREKLLVRCNFHPFQESMRRFWENQGWDVAYLNGVNTSRQHLREMIAEQGDKSSREVDLECRRIKVPFTSKRITLIGPLWWLVIRSGYREIITTDYMHSTILKFICMIKGVSLSYYLESDGSDPRKFGFTRRMINRVLLGGFTKYYFGFDGGDKLLGKRRSRMLPCMDLDLISQRGRSRNEVTNKRSSQVLKIIFVGLLCKKKGVDRLESLIKAIEKAWVGVGGESVIVTIVGEREKGSDENYILPSEWVKIAYMRHDDLLDEIKDNDYLVLPSKKEPMGAVVLEAMAVGTRVMVAREVGCWEVVERFNGGVVVDFEGDALAWRSQRLLEEEMVQGKGKRISRRILQRYNARVAEQVLKAEGVIE